MNIIPLALAGAWEIVPVQHRDSRGLFLEWYRSDRLTESVGHPLQLEQANISVSARGVGRGIHFAEVPPGQAKLVTCVRGAVFDVVVDLRVGSPTFGQWARILLNESDRNAVYIAEGLGHGFCALSDDATVTYLCSHTYAPGREHAVNALDPSLAIAWPTGSLVLSDRDAAAPLLSQAQADGLLPDYQQCLRWTESLRSRSAADP